MQKLDQMEPETITDEEVAVNLLDWRWRFAHLYWIEPAEASLSKLLFTPRKEQWEILEAIYERGEVRIAILKARQLGFSTLLSIICLDMAMWMGGFKVGIVEQSREKANEKLEKVKFAWKFLPDDIKACFKVIKDNDSEFSLEGPDDTVSTVYGGKKIRGGTHQLLWISEWGPIQDEDPRRSKDISSGALPSAEKGIVVVETTWKGGKSGQLYEEIVEPTLALQEEFRTIRDWKIYFYAWWLDKDYTFEGDVAQIDEDSVKYFTKLETDENIYLSDAQKLWYFKKAWPKGDARFEEFPSHLEEIFNIPTVGAIYADKMLRAETDGRITEFNATGAAVWTTWDLGNMFNTAVVYWELHGLVWRIIDEDIGEQWELAERVANMQAKGYNYGGHLLPHDGAAQQKNGATFREECERAGLDNVQCIPVTTDVTMRINNTRRALANIWFKKSRTAKTVAALIAYRYKEAADKSGYLPGVIQPGWMCHPSDAVGMMAEAEFHGMISRQQSNETRFSKPKVSGGVGY